MTFSGFVSLAWVHEFDPAREIYGTLLMLPGASWQVNAAQTGTDAAQVKAGVQMALTPPRSSSSISTEPSQARRKATTARRG
jgi:hypothetical protein